MATLFKVFKYVFIVIGILIFGFIGFVLNETKDEVNATPTNIDSILAKFYNPNRLAGFAVSIFNENEVLYSKGFGFADVENEIPFTTETLQRIASISKTTIGVSLLKAQELGLLKLDDPINNHLPFSVSNPNFPDSEITIRQLATHTSSLDYNEKVVESLYIDETNKSASLAPFCENYFVNEKYGAVLFTKNAPGIHWNYSNIGAGLAAYIIENVSKMSYADFSKTFIFDPLSLKNTEWFISELDSGSYITKYYEPQSKTELLKFDEKGVQLYPARDLITNVSDLTQFCQAIMAYDKRILNKNSYLQLLNPQLSSDVINRTVDNHGIFWMIDRNQYGITYQLTGSNGGDNCINTMMWFDPVTKLGYIFIGNTGGSEFNRANHIWIYRSLVSLGDNLLMNNPDATFIDKVGYKWHNVYNRVRGLF